MSETRLIVSDHRELLEVFHQPSERFGLLDRVIGMPAGRNSGRNRDRLEARLFLWRGREQRCASTIAPTISWTSLPEPARRHAPEGSFA